MPNLLRLYTITFYFIQLYKDILYDYQVDYKANYNLMSSITKRAKAAIHFIKFKFWNEKVFLLVSCMLGRL